MKKVNLLSKAQLKKITGGGGNVPCTKYVVCVNSSDWSETHYTNVCCNTWQDGVSFCASHGFSGPVGCIDNPDAPVEV